MGVDRSRSGVRSRCCRRKYPNPAIELEQQFPRAYGLQQGYSPLLRVLLLVVEICKIVRFLNLVSGKVRSKEYGLLLRTRRVHPLTVEPGRADATPVRLGPRRPALGSVNGRTFPIE